MKSLDQARLEDVRKRHRQTGLEQRRANVARIAADRRAAETCARGHSNWRIRPGDGHRQCVDCERDRKRLTYAEQRARRALTLVAAGLRVPDELLRPPAARRVRCAFGHADWYVYPETSARPGRRRCRTCQEERKARRLEMRAAKEVSGG